MQHESFCYAEDSWFNFACSQLLTTRHVSLVLFFNSTQLLERISGSILLNLINFLRCAEAPRHTNAITLIQELLHMFEQGTYLRLPCQVRLLISGCGSMDIIIHSCTENLYNPQINVQFENPNQCIIILVGNSIILQFNIMLLISHNVNAELT